MATSITAAKGANPALPQVKTIILSSKNIVPNTGNSVFQYNFPLGGANFKDNLIALESLTQYLSVFNVTQAYNNNSFSYIWVDGSINQVNIPNSFLELVDINAFMQSVMFANTHYVLSGTSSVFLLEIVVNPSRYADQINNYVISVALAATNGWTLPVGATWVIPNNLILPYLIVPNTNFGNLIGFAAGQYPAGIIAGSPPNQTQTPAFTSAQSELSSFAPQITPYSTFIVSCSLVNNVLVIPSNVLFSYSPDNTTFGKNSSYFPFTPGYNRIFDGQYSSFQLTITDQFFNPVVFNDPNSVLTLYLA